MYELRISHGAPEPLAVFGNIDGRHSSHEDENQNEEFHFDVSLLCC